MSSPINCKQYSPDDPNIDGSSLVESIESSETKICFICGTHTTLIINIHEPRCGPNMIDVISEKFQMRPLNDDKFLCYSCNNWLVNWYTMRKKNGESSNEDAQQTTSSTMSAEITANAHEQTATKTSDDVQHNDTNEVVIVSNEEDDENIDVNNIVQTLRNRLKKYLYYPKQQKCNDLHEWQTHPPTALIELNGSTDIDTNCEHCGKSLQRHSNRRMQRSFCRSCRFLMRRYGKCSTQRSKNQQQKPHISPLRDIHRSSHNHMNIFEKLQQLGTSIYYENECRVEQQRRKIQRHMSLIPHDMDTSKAHKKRTNAWERHRTNESNEILMTFNTVVTEVFPIDELYNKYYDRRSVENDQISNTSNNLNIQEILKNVPKSLTITIA